MSGSSSKTHSPPHLHLHVGTSSATTAATTAINGSAASTGSGSESSSHHSQRAPRRTPKADGGSGQINAACAACKYQRRRCTRDCLLAPYFPADQKLRFQNAHRLFGVSNMTRTLRHVEPKYRPDAMRTLIYQAEARAADPVGGCVRIIQELQRQMRDAETELQFVTQQIAIYRQASGTDGSGHSDPAAAAMILPAAANPEAAAGQQDDVTDAVAAICAAQQPSNPAGYLCNDPSSSHPQQLYDYFCYHNGAAGDDDDGGMQQYGLFADGSVKAESSPAVALGEQLRQHCQIQASPFDVKPQILPPATIQYHGPAVAGDVLPPRQKKRKLGAPFKFDHGDVVDDEHMEEQHATAGAPCHLELGFSSSFYNA